LKNKAVNVNSLKNSRKHFLGNRTRLDKPKYS